MDKKSNLLIIPTVYDQDGVCRDFNKPVFLQGLYNSKNVGKALQESFDVSKNCKISTHEEIKGTFLNLGRGGSNLYKFNAL